MMSLDRQPRPDLPPILTSGRPPSRFYYIDPMGLPDPADLVLAVSRAAAMGFDAILMPPPWPTGIDANRLLPSGFERVHPMLGGQSASHYITALAAVCAGHGLKLLLDLDVSQVAATCDGDVP